MSLYLIIFVILLRFAPFPFLRFVNLHGELLSALTPALCALFRKHELLARGTCVCVNVVYSRCLLNSCSFTVMFINNSLYSHGNGKICIMVAAGAQGLGRGLDTGYCIWAYFTSSFAIFLVAIMQHCTVTTHCL